MTESESIDYLESRANAHGMTYYDLMEMTPTSVSDCPRESAVFWEDKHISHKLASSTHPHLAQDPDNMMPEDPDANQQRGARPMTPFEEAYGHIDNEADAAAIDIAMDYDESGDYTLIIN